jgi:hypothetical protein
MAALASIEWGKIGQLIWVGPVAAFVISVTYSLLILGISRAGEARRGGAGGAAAAYGTVAVLAGAGFVGAVVYGIQIITTK